MNVVKIINTYILPEDEYCYKSTRSHDKNCNDRFLEYKYDIRNDLSTYKPFCKLYDKFLKNVEKTIEINDILILKCNECKNGDQIKTFECINLNIYNQIDN